MFMNLIEYAHHIPKTELHVHLEGSIRPRTLLQLAHRNGIQLPAHDEASLRDFYLFKNFDHFVEVYFTITGCLRTADDYRLIAYEFGNDCVGQNIRYVEATFTIFTNQQMTGLTWETILDGLNAGRDQARQEFGIEMRWIFDIVRDHPDTQDQVLEIALASRDRGCVALGLGGNEAKYPPELFKRTFQRAHQAGLPCIPHAGETAGPQSIWAAINHLNALRLGHGVRCIEDSSLVSFLRQQQIPLEICPTSNIALNVYSDYSLHPLRHLWDEGLVITVNSDDPPMFNTSLNNEYQILVEHFGFQAIELEQISLNGVSASLLPEADKARMEADFQAEFTQLRKNLAGGC
jgi:adenosine deaminase